MRSVRSSESLSSARAQLHSRAQERADTELARQEVACDAAAWLDDQVNDPPRALRALIKALPLCEQQAEPLLGEQWSLYCVGRVKHNRNGRNV